MTTTIATDEAILGWHWTYEPLIKILNRAVTVNHTIDEADIAKSQPMRTIGEYVIDNIVHTSPLVRSIQLQSWNGRRLSNRQIAVVYRILVDEYRDRLVKIAHEASKARPQLANGTYTVVSDTGASYQTIRLTECPESYGYPAGTQIAAYLFGPDNENNYRGFAFVLPGRKSQIWKNFRGDGPLCYTLGLLLESDDGLRYGEAYALMSGHCWHCRRKLTVPVSIHSGLGPICAKKLGITRKMPTTTQRAVTRAANDSGLFPESEVS